MQTLFLAISAVLIAGTRATLDFQCWNMKSTNEIRQIYYNRVNTLRKELANGNQVCANSANCPKGQNIYKLNWDCLLEEEAQKVVEKCDETATGPSELGMVIKKVPMTTCNPKPLFKQTVDEWWSQASNVQPSSPVMSNTNAKDFATLAYGKATRIGCAQKNCNENLVIACMVYGKGPADGEPIYETGEPCTAHDQCTTYEESRCQLATGLCLIGYPKNTTETTTTTTTTAPTTTTTTTTAAPTTSTQPQTTTLFPPGENSMCSGQQHIANDEIRQAFRDEHNKYRGLFARGEAQWSGGTVRPCCLMYKMEYNCGLEASAYAEASKCLPADSNSPGNGENQNTINNADLAFKDAAIQATQTWYEEVKTGKLEQGDGMMNYYRSSLGIPHLARMLWFNHKHIGCAIAKCSGFLKVVCHYDPSITDMEGRQIYKLCPNCNRCPQKDACLSSVNNGLCPA